MTAAESEKDGDAAPKQLVFDLPYRQAMAAEDFLISASNEAAVQVIDQWPNWASRAIVVVGPAGAGKSHLAQVWCQASGAAVLKAGAIGEATPRLLEERRALVIEDLDQGIADETVFFHLLNLAREKGFSILVSSRVAPGEIQGISLPDLRSRLRALPVVRIEEPDDGLLRGVLVKLFADRQLAVEPHIVSYLSLHMSRSMDMANRVVAEADRLSLTMQRRVTRAIAAEALATVAGEGERD